MLSSNYFLALKDRGEWLVENMQPMPDDELSRLVRSRIDVWEPEFQTIPGQP
jgi:hypothetical protein